MGQIVALGMCMLLFVVKGFIRNVLSALNAGDHGCCYFQLLPRPGNFSSLRAAASVLRRLQAQSRTRTRFFKGSRDVACGYFSPMHACFWEGISAIIQLDFPEADNSSILNERTIFSFALNFYAKERK